MEETELLELQGTVQDIKFTNEENGYTICTVCVEDEMVTFVGIMPFLAVGEEICAQGDFVVHKTYGEQFRVESYEKTLPQTAEAIALFLKSKAIRGVGEKTAARLVKTFGEETLDVIEQDYKQLTRVSGISPQKAKEIHDAFMEQIAISSIIEFLLQFDITPAEAVLIYQQLGDDTIEEIQRNPYVLCDENIGLVFERADGIARKLMSKNLRQFRCRAGVKHVIRHNYGNGHSFIPRDLLEEVSNRLLREEQDYVCNQVEEMLGEGELVCYQGGGYEAIYLPGMFLSELSIAEKLHLLDQFGSPIQNTDEEIDAIQQEFGIEYEHEQRRAIRYAMERGVFVLTGGPGTGKTTVIRAILQLLQKNRQKVVLAAPTGRAAKRMSEVTGEKATTIHRLLQVDFAGNIQRFVKNEKNPIKADCVIVDECSMVDIPLMDALLKAVRVGCKVILVGDSDQLPSIGPGNVLRDIIQSDCITTIHLTEIFRQAKESLIVVNAHSINSGELPELRVKNNDFFFLPCENLEDIAPLLISLCRDRLPKAYQLHSIRDIQAISPTRKKEGGTVYLNKMLQDTLNPPSSQKNELVFRDGVFRVGDKVMQVRNNYQMEWEDTDGEKGTGVFNGDIGEVTAVDPMNRLVYVLFDDKKVCYGYEQLRELELAYVLTVHKSQGSEFPLVIFVAVEGGERLTTRSLLYTAITRAKSMAILVGRERAIMRMVENNRQTKRYSSLSAMLGDVVMGDEE